MKKSISSTLVLIFLAHSLFSQNVGIGTLTPLARLHVADSSVVFTGATILPVVPGLPPVSGAGTRMMWYPGKAAFRAGHVGPNDIFGDGTAFWDEESIGRFSFASGYNTKAKGPFSTAMGHQAIAEGDFSTALGYVTVASGGISTAMGYQTKATGTYSTSMGWGTNASGAFSSTAMGFGNWAFGDASTAMGYKTVARGAASTSMGDSTISKAYASLSIGRYNDTITSSSPNSWVAADPLFYLGNGTTHIARSNAMIVYKNGNTDISGYTQLGKTSEAAPSIKMKKLTGVSSATQNTWVNIPHGLTLSKIISVNIIMIVPGYVNMPPSYNFQAGYEYDYQIASTNIVVLNANGNSANILSKNFTVFITYEE